MADTAAHLVDRIVPHVPVRQWVLTLPVGLRYRMAFDGQLTGEVLRAFLRTLFASLRRRALRVTDSVRETSIVVERIETFGDTWAFETELNMISYQRDAGLLPIGAVVQVFDGSRRVSLVIGPSAVGFEASAASVDWVNDVSVAITPGYHVYRVLKTASEVRLFIDDAAQPAITHSYADFPSSTSEFAVAFGTSVAGTSDFENRNFTFNTDGGLTTAVPATSPTGLWIAAASVPGLSLLFRRQPSGSAN